MSEILVTVLLIIVMIDLALIAYVIVVDCASETRGNK